MKLILKILFVAFTLPDYAIAQELGCGNDITLTASGDNSENAVALNCGNTSFNSELSAENEKDFYAFEADAGEVVNVQMKGYDDGVDPLIKIMNAQGSVLIQQSSMNKMTSIKDFNIPSIGQYYISVEDYNGNDTGKYGFSFQKLIVDVCSSKLECGMEEMTANFGLYSEMDVYQFEGKAGQSINFIMSEIDEILEPAVRFYAPDGHLIFADEQSAHVDISDYILPNAGVYTIVCTDKFGNGQGKYKINFEVLNSDGSTNCETCDDGSGIQASLMRKNHN